MENNWVDFKAVKAAVPILAVLQRYQVNGLKKGQGSEWRGRCPIHQGEGADAFHVNTEKNCFHCFACGKRGNVLDFVAAMEGCGVRDAALKIQQWFLPAGESGRPGAVLAASTNDGGGKNPALALQLKGVDGGHAYLVGRGISRETAEHFGVGFFSGKGSMSGRVVIPIHNGEGELVAYAGRAVDCS